jgi:hypothetical protein
MPNMKKPFQCEKQQWLRWLIVGVNIVFILILTHPSRADIPVSINGIYMPPQTSLRPISEAIHYAGWAKLNAVVLHVKDPRGLIFWRSKHPIAQEIGAIHCCGQIERAVKRLNDAGIWTIAKIDIFEDSLLVKKYPEMAVLDKQTGEPWADKKGLHWVNPYDRRVWDYNIALCKELVEIGFDEIQFDYIRFPADGDLKRIHYPLISNDLTKAQCIGDFLKTAYAELKPLNVVISIDVFGMIAWKKEDFGVGQVLEEIAPNIDVICPMFYPSHFPVGFLGHQNPGNFPHLIMEKSMKQLKKRTNKKIRPWIQGFWYSTGEINAQLDGLTSAGTSSWTVWNPAGRYATTYRALAQRMNIVFPEAKFYPSLTELYNKNDRIIRGHSRTVHFTDYRKGYTILSLEESKNGHKSAYSTPIAVINTLDEAIMDFILSRRNIPFRRYTNKATKSLLIAHLLCKDLNIEPHRIRPKPIYIDWRRDCHFTYSLPPKRQYHYGTMIAFTRK